MFKCNTKDKEQKENETTGGKEEGSFVVQKPDQYEGLTSLIFFSQFSCSGKTRTSAYVNCDTKTLRCLLSPHLFFQLSWKEMNYDFVSSQNDRKLGSGGHHRDCWKLSQALTPGTPISKASRFSQEPLLLDIFQGNCLL